MKIAISAESTIDLPKELREKFKINTVPFTVIMGEKEFLDGEVSSTEIFEFVKKTNVLPKTSAVNTDQYFSHFSNLLKSHDAVIHFSLSSEMSSAYKNALGVASTIKNVYVVDSRSLSTGIALLAIKARTLADEGKSPSEIVETCTELTKLVRASFILDKLDYLKKGGRCSALVAFGANLFQIKPQIVVSNGKMAVGKKYIGKYEKNVAKYCEDTLIANPNVDTSCAFITYTTATLTQIESARNALIKKGFSNIYETTAGGTISSHCGPNTLGILFIAKQN